MCGLLERVVELRYERRYLGSLVFDLDYGRAQNCFENGFTQRDTVT